MKIIQSFFHSIFKYFRNMTKKKYRECAIIGSGLFVIAIVFLFSNGFGGGGKNQVYANQAADASTVKATIGSDEVYDLHVSLLGIIEGVSSVEEYSNKKNTMNTEYSFEEIIVGKSIQDKESAEKLSLVKNVQKSASSIETLALKTVQEQKMSEKDYDALLHIVEAEATGEGIKGKILIANVILNRIKDPRFPDTAYEVIWDNANGITQFSPTEDGRIKSVTVSEETVEAVNRAIDGEDYSKGAQYFSARAQADPTAMQWFDKSLEKVLEYGNHEFYRKP